MLVSMVVRNIALIEHLEIVFGKGMHVLSGETGAGKSIIVDSINLMLGERADRGLIRSGCEKASVEAFIDISSCPAVAELLREQEIEPEDGLISVQREISVTGRNTCRVCGVIVPLTFLRNLTAQLVDIHGQHEHQSLLDSQNHMSFLDSFGEADFQAILNEVSEAYHAWRASSSKFSALRKENSQRVERQSFLESRVKELDLAAVEVGEVERLAAEKARFSSAEKIDRSLRTAYEETMGNGRDKSALGKLREAADSMRLLEEIDPAFKMISVHLSNVYYEVEELGLELRNLLESQNFDPEQNEAVQDRLDQIRKLERRYGMPADELASYHEEIRDELNRLGSLEDRLKAAETDFKQKLQVYRAKASQLTQERKRIAESFERVMENHLKELGMANTRFACVFEQPEPGQKKIPTPHGDDHVCFYIAPNPGEPLKPLDKTASGGELSRLMLALKAAGAEHGGIPCMIFDEIDTGISGHIAGVVAEKMASIARYHQVLCVTHLAQIAAMADVQYFVQKQVIGERTCTGLTTLDEAGRVKEIARLIGVTQADQESGIAHAKAILQSASQWKNNHFFHVK